MLITHPHGRRVELLRSIGGRLLPVSPDATGTLRSEALDVGFATVDGRLEITWEGGSAQV